MATFVSPGAQVGATWPKSQVRTIPKLEVRGPAQKSLFGRLGLAGESWTGPQITPELSQGKA